MCAGIEPPTSSLAPDKGSSVVEAILAALNSRTAALSPGTVIGAGVHLQTGPVRQALLAFVLGPPAVAGGKILAE